MMVDIIGFHDINTCRVSVIEEGIGLWSLFIEGSPQSEN